MLLIVGGLTVDRFVDGSVRAGWIGAALRAGRGRRGAALTMLTVAGDEPAARDGLARLASIGDARAPAARPHDHLPPRGARRASASSSSRRAPIRSDPTRCRDRAAPTLPSSRRSPTRCRRRSSHAWCDDVAPARIVLLIQGWLRRLAVGEEVHPLPLDALSADQRAGDGRRRRDRRQHRGPRRGAGRSVRPGGRASPSRVGPRPIVVVTLGARGLPARRSGDRPRHRQRAAARGDRRAGRRRRRHVRRRPRRPPRARRGCRAPRPTRPPTR